MTIINDNTELQELVAAVPDGLKSLFVFTSAKGRDGVILDHTSAPAHVEEYGKPNFKLFGQPQLNAYAYLSGGQTKAFSMRVMPEDATYSNLVVVAKVKVDKTDVANPKMLVRFELMQHQGLNNKEDVAGLTELITVTTPDVDGFATYPLFAFYSLGRGGYGNAFRIRVLPSTQADQENDYRNIRVEVLELENSLARKEVFNGSVFPDALEGMNSIYIPDVVNDVDTGSQKLGLYTSEENFRAIYELYKAEVAPTTDITEELFSVLSGTVKGATTLIPGYSIDTASVDAAALDNPEGLPLGAGDDGAFKYDVANLADRETAIDAAYIAAFEGTTDRSILSKRRVPCEIILDAGYSDEVKRALISLMVKRYDAYCFIDGGILNTVTDAIAWGESMEGLGDRIFSKEFQHYKIRDPFTGKIIPVTITFFYALRLATHFRTNGNQVPFVGEDFATLTGAIKNSLKPVVDADDSETKEALYKLRLNYFQALSENTFVRGTQSTSQNIWSDLSEEHNMHVLLEMKRKLENMIAGLSYNFAEADDRSRFSEDANRMFEGYAGNKVRSASVSFSMNAWEEERSILHCYLGVIFRTISKRSVVEIDINKRV
jgi:hypothetical protein